MEELRVQRVYIVLASSSPIVAYSLHGGGDEEGTDSIASTPRLSSN